MDNALFPLFGTAGLFLVCGMILIGSLVSLFVLWVYIACLIDVFSKTEAEFPERTLWIVLLLGTLFFGMMWLVALIYYFLYRPKLAFW